MPHQVVPVLFDGKSITFSQYHRAHDYRDISDKLTRYLKKGVDDMTDSQMNALEVLRAMMRQASDSDRGVGREAVWTQAEAYILFTSINDLFFGGALLTSAVSYGFTEGTPGQDINWGLTECLDPNAQHGLCVRITVYDFLSMPHIWKRRAEALFAALCAIAHEGLHAMFYLHACKCSGCFASMMGGDLRPDGHGPFWEVPAHAMSEMFLKMFEDVAERSPFAHTLLGNEPLGWAACVLKPLQQLFPGAAMRPYQDPVGYGGGVRPVYYYRSGLPDRETRNSPPPADRKALGKQIAQNVSHIPQSKSSSSKPPSSSSKPSSSKPSSSKPSSSKPSSSKPSSSSKSSRK